MTRGAEELREARGKASELRVEQEQTAARLREETARTGECKAALEEHRRKADGEARRVQAETSKLKADVEQAEVAQAAARVDAHKYVVVIIRQANVMCAKVF